MQEVQQYRRGMKVKTIKTVIQKKVSDWISSIEDKALREQVASNTIITGGCVASMLLGEQVNDYDVYFRNRETAKAVAEYYVERFEPGQKRGIPCEISVDESKPDRIRIVIKSSGIAREEKDDEESTNYAPYNYFEGVSSETAAGQYVGEVMQDPGDIEDAYIETEELAQQAKDEEGMPKYRPVFMSTNAITLSNRIQIVLRFYGEPEQLHENYDFVHCTNYWKGSSKGGELVLNPKALESLLSRELRYIGSKYPICSLIRTRKFIRRGWTINAGQLLKICMQISELNLKDHTVLEEQLTGVDVAYFVQLLAKLKEKDPEKINSAYLVEIIDRMF